MTRSSGFAAILSVLGGRCGRSPDLSSPVTKVGTGTGTIGSNPAGLECGLTCIASFALAIRHTQRLGGGGVPPSRAGAARGAPGTGQCTVAIEARARTRTALFTSRPFSLHGDKGRVPAPAPSTSIPCRDHVRRHLRVPPSLWTSVTLVALGGRVPLSRLEWGRLHGPPSPAPALPPSPTMSRRPSLRQRSWGGQTISRATQPGRFRTLSGRIPGTRRRGSRRRTGLAGSKSLKMYGTVGGCWGRQPSTDTTPGPVIHRVPLFAMERRHYQAAIRLWGGAAQHGPRLANGRRGLIAFDLDDPHGRADHSGERASRPIRLTDSIWAGLSQASGTRFK